MSEPSNTPSTTPAPEPTENLVRIFDSEQETEAQIVQGLLQSAGIDAALSSLDFPQDTLPIGGTVVLVREADAETARNVIDAYRHTPLRDEEATDTPPAREDKP